jgi:hypothetical protein
MTGEHATDSLTALGPRQSRRWLLNRTRESDCGIRGLYAADMAVRPGDLHLAIDSSASQSVRPPPHSVSHLVCVDSPKRVSLAASLFVEVDFDFDLQGLSLCSFVLCMSFESVI